MALIRLINPSKKQMQKTKVNRNLSWYDVEKKEMKTFTGGRLSFQYKYDDSLPKPRYRLLPHIEDVEDRKEAVVIDLKAIDKWLRIHQDWDFIDIVGKDSSGSILLAIPDNELREVTDSLEIDNIPFEGL